MPNSTSSQRSQRDDDFSDTDSIATQDGERKNLCFGCNINIDDRTQIVKCKRCSVKYHSRCAKKCDTLQDGSLSKCCSTLTKGDMRSFLSSFARDLKKDIVYEFNKSLSILENRLDIQDAKIIELETKIATLESSKNVNRNPTVDKEDLFTEIEERRIRSKNIIVYGLANESEECDDLLLINDIFKQISDFPMAVSTRKIGVSRGNGTIPVKVTFQNDTDSRYILKFKNKLGKFKISVKNDLTPEQQRYLKNLSQELNNRIERGEKNLTIKYIKGNPKIVMKNAPNSNKKN